MMDFALRSRRILLSLLGAALALATLQAPPDYFRFAGLADQILRGNLAAGYASDWNQAGPLQLVLARVLLIGGGADGSPARLTVVAVQAGLVLLVLQFSGRRDAPGAVRRDLLVGGCVLLWCAVGQPWNGHPAEILIPIGWFVALRLERSGHAVPAAVALGLTAAVAPWGVLAFPALLSVDSLPRAVRTGLLAAGVALASYAPFLASGRFELFHHRWLIDTDSLVHLLDPTAGYAGWPIRLIQALAVGGGCALVAVWTRTRPDGPLLSLLAAALLRVAADPTTFNYYWLSVAVLSILLLAQAASVVGPMLWLTAGLAYLAWAGSTFDRQWIPAVLGLGLLLSLVLRDRRTEPAAAECGPVEQDAGYGVPAHA